MQVGIAVLLLSGAGSLVQSLERLAAAPLGFDSSNVLTMRIASSAERYPSAETAAAFDAELLGALAGIQGVESVAAVEPAPVGRVVHAFRDRGAIRGGKRAWFWMPNQIVASAGYFETIRTPVVEGRTFSDAGQLRFAAGRRSQRDDGAAILGPPQPGRREDSRDRAGVAVANRGGSHGGRSLGARWIAGPEAFFVPLPQSAEPPRNVACAPPFATPVGCACGRGTRPGDGARPGSPGVPGSDPRPDRPGFAGRGRGSPFCWMSGFAGAALFLAVGLAGAVAFSVARRRREIGIRMAMGATPSKRLRLFLSEAAPIFLAEAGAGLAGGIALARGLRSVLDWTSPASPVLFGAILLVLAAVMVCATLLPVRRATRVEAAEALHR